jgi:RNA polymerase sigma-70 factor (ECF subfamily)
MDQNSHDWTTLLDRHGPALALYARQWSDTAVDAEDIVQEAFVRFWRSRHRAADPVAYMFGCVKRFALQWRRSNQRRLRREEAAARPDDEPNSLIDAFEESERRSAITTSLNLLPADQREVLVMKIWGGLTFTQIAEAASIPVHTAASRYRYALDKMRDLLATESIR